MYVYIIQSGTSRKAPLKIGVSDDPGKRIKQLQTGNPEVLKVLTTIRCKTKKHAYTLEGELHRMLSDKSILNEWFSCAKKSALNAISRLANNESIPQVKKHEDIFKDKTAETIKADSIRKKALNGMLDSSIKAMKKENANRKRMIKELTTAARRRKIEAGKMRKELIRLGFTGNFDELLGRGKYRDSN